MFFLLLVFSLICEIYFHSIKSTWLICLLELSSLYFLSKSFCFITGQFLWYSSSVEHIIVTQFLILTFSCMRYCFLMHQNVLIQHEDKAAGQQVLKVWKVVMTFIEMVLLSLHTQKKFSIRDFISKCDRIRRKLRIWSHLLKKFLIESFIFVLCMVVRISFLDCFNSFVVSNVDI